jgi:zinc transport system substrate-binding protein
VRAWILLSEVVFGALVLHAAVSAEPVRVFVGVPPLQTLVERVGGSSVEVLSLVQPGQSPHTYEPTPRQVAALGSADLYLGIGMPFESAQLPRIRAANPRLRVIDVREGVEVRRIEAHDHGPEDHDRGRGRDTGPDQGGGADRRPAGQAGAGEGASELDPHVWTSPPLALRIARVVRDALIEIDPANARVYEANHQDLAAELERLDQEIRAELEPIRGARFMVYHPAWGYFADTYGLTQVPIEKAGKEPGPRSLAALIDQARRDRVQVIFAQPQMGTRPAEQVAAAIGGRVVVIDPLSPDYPASLREAARAIAEAARR